MSFNWQMQRLWKAKESTVFNCGCGGMADALDLGSSTERCGGSSPFTRTIERNWALRGLQIVKNDEYHRYFTSPAQSRGLLVPPEPGSSHGITDDLLKKDI